MNFSNALKNASVDGSVKQNVAVAIGQKADSLVTELCEVLKKVEGQVGMVYGEMINDVVSRATGVRFDPKEYNFERRPEGQE